MLTGALGPWGCHMTVIMYTMYLFDVGHNWELLAAWAALMVSGDGQE